MSFIAYLATFSDWILLGADIVFYSCIVYYRGLHFIFCCRAQVITTSSRDFGPLLHTGSAAKVDSVSRGLFSEHFVRSAIKWKICPRDFRSIVQLKYGKKSDNNMHGQTDTPDVHCADSKNQVSEAQNFVTNDLGIRMKYVGRDLQNKTEIETEISEDFDCATKKPNDESSADSECQHLRPTHRESSLLQSHETPSDSRGQHDIIEGGELRFTLSGVSREDLGSGEGGGCRVFRRVLQRGIQRAIKADSLGYEVR